MFIRTFILMIWINLGGNRISLIGGQNSNLRFKPGMTCQYNKACHSGECRSLLKTMDWRVHDAPE